MSVIVCFGVFFLIHTHGQWKWKNIERFKWKEVDYLKFITRAVLLTLISFQLEKQTQNDTFEKR